MSLQSTHSFQYHCPCCDAEYVTFGNVQIGELLNGEEIKQSPPGVLPPPAKRQAVGTCQNPDCKQMVVFRLQLVRSVASRGTVHFGGNAWIIESTSPERKRATASELLPPDVRQCMVEAEQTLIARDIAPRIARAAFRTVLDVATKDIARKNPECLGDKDPSKITLYSRINILAKAKLISPELQTWAHEIRGITNEDVHTVESVSKEEAQEIADITRLILTYLFELPERVKLAKAAADAKKAEGNG